MLDLGQSWWAASLVAMAVSSRRSKMRAVGPEMHITAAT